ncbi:MAG: L-lactate permease [Phycisphaerae bacterium]|nr:L-lactate permease [Phycisphaerae bacterium]
MPWDLLLTLLPIAVVLIALLVFRRPADISGVIGWGVIALVAFFFFQTSWEVIARSTAAGFIRSFPVSMIVAASLLQMALMEKTGALKRVVLFIKTLASDNRAVSIMMVSIGFGTLMVAVGATPVSVLPPILIAMGYTTYVAIALPAIGYDSLCTYALLGAPIVVFVDFANRHLGLPPDHVNAVTLSQAGMVFYKFLPVVSTLIGFGMLWIVGRGKAMREGALPCLVTGGVIAVVAYFTNRQDNLVVLTGVFCGLAVIVAMVLYLKIGGKRVIDASRLTVEEKQYAAGFSLFRALTPWLLLIGLILVLNLPKPIFEFLYGVGEQNKAMRLPITGLTANEVPISTRALWQAYTWIFVSTFLAIPLLRPTKAQLADTFRVWFKRAPRPVFAAAIFFAIGEIMEMTGWNMHKAVYNEAGEFVRMGGYAVPSMVQVLADYSANAFQGAYGAIAAFIGLLGGFVTGSEASTIATFATYTMKTSNQLWPLDQAGGLEAMLIVTAGLAFGGGLASVISPAKLQNAAASIDKIGEEGKVMRVAFVLSLILTSVTAAFVMGLLAFNK